MLKEAGKLSYLDFYTRYKDCLPTKEAGKTGLDNGMVVERYPFRSEADIIFPEDKQYYAPKLSGSSLNLDQLLFEGAMDDIIQMSDSKIHENISFHYNLFYDPAHPPSDAIVLLHGLNEKDWSKYIPWAIRLVELTKKAVILFPLAFHIERAHDSWHDGRAMNRVSKKRSLLFKDIHNTSFANAAMSTRLHFAPVRFFLSGLQTYNDLIQLIQNIRQSHHPLLPYDARIDFLGYSAGAFLAKILVMANRHYLVDESKVLMFCGGALLSRMHLSSRYIMDSAAYQAILDYYVRNFDQQLLQDPLLSQLFEATQTGGSYFRSLLGEQDISFNQFRKKRLEEVASRMRAITLEKDTVMPPTEVKASLLGTQGVEIIPTQVLDFPHEHSHVMPFPYQKKISEAVSQSFERVMQEMAAFFSE